MRHWYIGCSGFHYPGWKNIFYPRDLPQRKWFEYYCTQFNTLELNVTFYRFPTAELLKSWFDKSPASFVFSVKAPRLITHYKKFDDCKRLLNDFYSAVDKGLKNKSGVLLFQLPAAIEFSEEKLQQIIASMNSSFVNTIEFRHPSWWNKKVYDSLAENRISFCTISHPQLPDKVIVNTENAYIRFHGVPKLYFSPYDNTYLQKVCDKLKKHKKIETVYIYFNNTATGSAIQNAQMVKKFSLEK